MERKLASLQKISSISPIYVQADGAEAANICQVTVGGWRLIANKADFKVGDLCVYFEIDSVFNPELPWVSEHFAFMKKHKWAVRTLKMNKFMVGDPQRVVISQGLAMPLRIIPDIALLFPVLEEGTDLTNWLGITKKPEPIIAVDQKGPFPAWLRKTDEPRLQSSLKMLEEMHAASEVIITTKIDGTSCTVWWEDDGLHLASRNFEIDATPQSVYRRAVEPYLSIFEQYRCFAFQGEVFGEGIQGNKCNLKGLHFAVFNIYDRECNAYVPPYHTLDITTKLGIPHVPVVLVHQDFNVVLEDLEQLADNSLYGDANHPAEGIVVRPLHTCPDSPTYGGALSFKVINRKFLLKYE